MNKSVIIALVIVTVTIGMIASTIAPNNAFAHRHRGHHSGQNDNNNGGGVAPGRQQFEQPPLSNTATGVDNSNGRGLMSACLKSGFSESQCNNYLFSKNPGGFCTTLRLANVPCPNIKIQQEHIVRS